jgi:hypothetical protein
VTEPSPTPAGTDAPAPAPRGPWTFLRAAAAGGFSPLGWQLLAAWAAFSLSTSTLWALHLGRLTGWSSLPSYWGEILTSRDLWELMENGGLRGHWTGPWVPLAAAAAFAWFLWAGWRLQAAILGVPARLGPWLWGAADALVLGVLPLSVLAGLLTWGLDALGATGISWLGWLDWGGGVLVRLTWASALVLQWWLCRLGRAAAAGGQPLRAHLGRGLRHFWRHAGQWGALLAAGVLLRTGLGFLVLALAWRWGGDSIPKVVGFLALQLAAVVVNAWLIGWFLRLSALYLAQETSSPNL